MVRDDCATCGFPHEVAPELVGWSSDDAHCIWKKQPTTSAELDRAIEVIHVADLACHRYAGRDPEIIARIGRELADHPDILDDYPDLERAWEHPLSRILGDVLEPLSRIWKRLRKGRS